MTHAPQNIAFVLVGWLYGEDFGDALLKCVNCGWDTDSTGATLGALLGIIDESDGIPERWRDPVGTDVVTRPEVQGFAIPDDLHELTDRTQAVANGAAVTLDLPVEIRPTGERPESRPQPSFRAASAETPPRTLWNRPPNVTEYLLPPGSTRDPRVRVTIAYGADGPAIGRGQTKAIEIGFENSSKAPWDGRLSLETPTGWETVPDREFGLAPGESLTWTPVVGADQRLEPAYELELNIDRTHDGASWSNYTVPVSLVSATHWKMSGPGTGERETTFPGNRIAFTEELETEEPGTYRAESSMYLPTAREIRFVVATRSPVTATIDRSNVIDGGRKPNSDPRSIVTVFPAELRNTNWPKVITTCRSK